ncbi:unnamed protein product [Amoebophrya sp. A25]|nr:unnamed protein product [Amoebophrya sp. A25]|eukprot:GSA25T00017515001.1
MALQAAGTKTQMTPEEQLEDLTRRFQLLEGERKATYETAQLNIRQNKEIIKQMKDESKMLRQQIALHRNESAPSLEKQVEEKTAHCNSLKRQLDSLRHEVAQKKSLLEDLRAKLEDLQDASNSQNIGSTAQSRQIRVLENRLDKAMIKYNEAQTIRRTYEQIVKRLREERTGFDSQLAQLEETLRARERDYEELLLLSHDAYHAKEMAQAELHRFEQGVMEERNQRDKEVQEKKALVQQRVEMNQRLQQRERMLKQQQDLDRAGEIALKTTSAMADLAAGISSTQAEEERHRLHDYEDAFRRIKEATGVADVNEVIQKFLTQEDTQNQLLKLTVECQAKIDSLTEQRKQLKGMVDERKFSSAGNIGKRQVVDDFETHLSEASAKCERNKGKYERIAKVLIDLKTGVDHLATKLVGVKLDGESPIEVTDETVEDVLSQCEFKLSKLMSITHLEGAKMGKSRSQKIDLAYYEEKMMQKSQSDIRVHTHDQDDEELDDDEFDDDVEEDVWNRRSIKHNSQVIQDQNTKRKKRAAGKGKK